MRPSVEALQKATDHQTAVLRQEVDPQLVQQHTSLLVVPTDQATPTMVPLAAAAAEVDPQAVMSMKRIGGWGNDCLCKRTGKILQIAIDNNEGV